MDGNLVSKSHPSVEIKDIEFRPPFTGLASAWWRHRRGQGDMTPIPVEPMIMEDIVFKETLQKTFRAAGSIRAESPFVGNVESSFSMPHPPSVSFTDKYIRMLSSSVHEFLAYNKRVEIKEVRKVFGLTVNSEEGHWKGCFEALRAPRFATNLARTEIGAQVREIPIALATKEVETRKLFMNALSVALGLEASFKDKDGYQIALTFARSLGPTIIVILYLAKSQGSN